MAFNDKNKIAIKFDKLFNSHGEYYNGYLLIKNGIIEGIYNKNKNNYTVLDYSDKIITPGFIDLHTHGYYGVDSMDSSEGEMHYWAGRITEHGVTTFIPTGVSSSFDKMKQFLNKMGSVMENQKDNEAIIYGARLEGPYISLNKKGAHNTNYIRGIDINEIQELSRDYNNILRIIDIAPELEGFNDAFNILTGSNIIVSAGHTDADFAIANNAFKLGVRLITHFYNAMSPFNHRNPGMVGAGFLSENIFLELISDLHHVSKEAIEILIDQVGLSRIILITDSLSIGSSGNDSGILGDLDIELKDNVAWIRGTDTIAGSILTPDKALKNLMSMGIKPENIIPSMTSIPANLLGINNTGDLLPGKAGNLCILDKDFNVNSTLINGNIVYEK
jgi:N-acetylglucosamine-6-phosphate deacetylase